MKRLSIIVPVLNEASLIVACLQRLQCYRSDDHEIIVIDGGSDDGTPELARRWTDIIATSPRGRAKQMNAGAALSQAQVLLFLHADTTLPEHADALIAQNLATDRFAWGRFDVYIEGMHPLLPLIGTCMNVRSRLTGIATGDQAIFVRREHFELLHGFPDIALMEDIELSKRLLDVCGRPACIRTKVKTSGRRWEERGVVKTMLLMWLLRLAYFGGVNPDRLARSYGYR